MNQHTFYARTLLTFLVCLFCLTVTRGQNQEPNLKNTSIKTSNTIISAEYGPPTAANTWQKFSIPLTAETFNVDAGEFEAVMQSVSLIRIRTEMHSGSDIGAVDSIKFGDRFISTFDANNEGWSAMGDGTMTWEATGGAPGGHITIADWASGDWHWATAPSSWGGDLTDQVGKNFCFYYKTNQNSYSAVVEIHSSETRRIILTANQQTLTSGEVTQMEVSLSPTPTVETTINLSSSNGSLLSVTPSVVIPANNSSAMVTLTAANDISADNSVVITASSSGYPSSRVTIKLEKNVSVPQILSTSYGPPATANTWEKFIIPITAATFNVTEAEFAAAMKRIKLVRIRTEMHTGDDRCGVDSVKLGDRFVSTFDTGTENWSAMGDGTMFWKADDGVNGGHITIEDWATGDWHWATAPVSWSGDLSNEIGKNFCFYYQTNQPSYSAVVEFHTGESNRIVLSAEKQTLVKGESTNLTVSLSPVPAENVVVTLTSSQSSYLVVPASVTIPGGSSSATVSIDAAADIPADREVVITAKAPDYQTTYMTILIMMNNSVEGTLENKVKVYPNPANNKVCIQMMDGNAAQTTILLFNYVGQLVATKVSQAPEAELNVNQFPAGFYTLEIRQGNTIITKKLIVE